MSVQTTFSQQVPAAPSLVTAEDYRIHEPSVITNIKWISSIPRDTVPDDRRMVEDFLIKWIYGCPYLRVVIEPYAMKASSKNADLLVSFLFGYALYRLEHPQEKPLLNANVAGVSMLIDDYQKNRISFNRSPELDELISIKSQGTLSQWITGKLAEK